MPYSEAHSLRDSESAESQKTTGAVPPEEIVEKSEELPAFTKASLLADANELMGLGALPRDLLRSNDHIMQGWLYGKPNRESAEVYAAVRGCALMRDRDEIGWDSAKPGTPMALRALIKSMTVADQGDGTVLRNLYDVAVEYWRTHDVESTKRRPRSKTMRRIEVSA